MKSFDRMFSDNESVHEIERMVYSATMQHGRGITAFINNPDNGNVVIVYESLFEDRDDTSIIGLLNEQCQKIVATYDMAAEYVVAFIQENHRENCVDVDFFHIHYRFVKPKVALSA